MKLIPPQSKSDAQRALVLAAITGTKIALETPAPRDAEILSRSLGGWGEGAHTIDCHDGGAPFRFLLGQAAVTPNRITTFTGTQRLAERPHAPLLEALKRALPALQITEGNPWPVVVRAPSAIDAVHFEIDAKLSSQFASSLLLAAARVSFTTKQPCTVKIAPGMTSEGYFKLTLRWLSHFGFSREETQPGLVTIAHVRPPHADLEIPGDWSSIGYLLALSWISKLPVARMHLGSGHPDEVVIDSLGTVGLALDENDVITGTPRRAFEDVDASFAPDSVPTLAAIATKLPKPSRFLKTGILKAKESDRLEGTRRLLRAAGLRSELDGETLTVHPGNIASDFDFDARDDHRMAMTAAVLARLHGRRVKLLGAESVAKSFPNFWLEARKAGVELA
ncbi:MAG: 3-phosphoshikimate 1-carboxyvinyltransferase [Archangium sp.]|nr:3-phosphoshikimate 1-carboxyvinyltransferase [Archangium sp.]